MAASTHTTATENALQTLDTRGNLREFLAGAVGGVAQVMIGQPFDLIKVRAQTLGGGSAAKIARNIWVSEGPLAFYKGSLLPLLGVGACVSIQFGAYENFVRLLRQRKNDTALSTTEFYLAGGLAGVTNSVISGPIEHIRIRLQTQPQGAAKLYHGPWDCIRKIVRAHGISGLYKGQVITVLREFHGYGIWFAAYESCVSMATRLYTSSGSRDELPAYMFAACGGLAGEALWLGSHPLDVLKSKMQSDGFGKDRKYANLRATVSQTWRSGRTRAMFSGLGPALLRAMPVSAGTFGAVELVRSLV